MVVRCYGGISFRWCWVADGGAVLGGKELQIALSVCGAVLGGSARTDCKSHWKVTQSRDFNRKVTKSTDVKRKVTKK